MLNLICSISYTSYFDAIAFFLMVRPFQPVHQSTTNKTNSHKLNVLFYISLQNEVASSVLSFQSTRNFLLPTIAFLHHIGICLRILMDLKVFKVSLPQLLFLSASKLLSETLFAACFVTCRSNLQSSLRYLLQKVRSEYRTQLETEYLRAQSYQIVLTWADLLFTFC